jgi:hypothetical protein
MRPGNVNAIRIAAEVGVSLAMTLVIAAGALCALVFFFGAG